MKKIVYIVLLLVSSFVFSQNKGITYQAVIYIPGGQNIPGVNVNNVPMTNKAICLQFSFLDANAGIEYEEVIKTTTDTFGMVNITIGLGNQTGGYATSFSGINWSATANKTLKVALDPTGLCNQFEELSSEVLTSVPFANAANTATNVSGVVALVNGGTGATSAAGARINLGLGNVDNTSDLNKPMSTATKAYVDSQIVSSTIPDATTTSKGKIQLAGDLGGTAAAPTVPGLALKANSSDVTTSLATKENTANKSTDATLASNSDVKFPTEKAVKTYVDTQVAGATIADASSSNKGKIQLAGDLAGTAAAPTVPGLALKANSSDVTTSLATKENTANKSTDATLASNSDVKFPTEKAVKTYVDTQVAGATIADASSSNKGKIQLAGDLGGTAAAPTVPGLALKANLTDLTTEVNRATAAEATLTTNVTVNATAITAETTRATAAEATLTTNLASEVTRATGAESTLTTNVTANATAITAETTRAIAAEATLTTNVTSNATAIAAETTRATAAEATLTTNLASEVTRATAAEALKAPLASPTFTGTVSGIDKTMVGLGNVDNTSDANKPVSTATQTALDLKENLANKSTDITADANSTTKYPSVKLIKDYVDTLNAAAGVADGSITSAKITDGTIMNIDVNANAAIDYSKLNLSNSIVTSDIVNDAVETAKIKNANVTTAKLADDAVETVKIKNAAVTNTKLDKANIPLSGFGAAAADVALGANKLTGVADPTLAQDAATKNYVDTKASDITTLADGKIYVGNVSNEATEVTLTGDVTITNTGVTAIGASKVVTTMIAAANVTTAKLADDAVETVKIKNANVTTAKLADNAVTTAKITDANVTNAKLDKSNIPLSGFGAAAADVNLGSNKLINVTDPTNAQDAATKNYVDTKASVITTLADGKIYVGNASNEATEVTPTGDVTMTNAGVTAIGTGKVLTTMIADANVTTAKLAADAITSAKIKDGEIVNADISASAAIVDTKLATITTSGKVSNSATSATDANTASAIVARDANGDFAAGTITADLDGNAATVTNGVYTTDKISVLSATTSSELKGVISDETGSGALVFATSPTLVTPTLGVATATSVNGLTPTALTTGFTISGGSTTSKTLTVSGDATVSGTTSGTNTGDQTITLTGDVTGSGTGSFAATIGTGKVTTATIAADAVTSAKIADGTIVVGDLADAAVETAKIKDANITYAKIQNVSATDKVLGRVSTGAGVIEEIATTGSGNVVRATSPTLVTPALGTPSAAVLTNATGLPLTSGVTGTLPVANGGTGATSLTANNVLLGNGTSAIQTVAPSTAGNILRSDGTTWSSSALSLDDLSDAINEGSSGNSNIAIGTNAMYSNTGNSSQNIGIGLMALKNTNTANQNVAIGQYTMGYNKTLSGSGNVAIGRSAMNQITSGSNNTAIGLGAGGFAPYTGDFTGTNNTYIGYNASPSSLTASNEIVLGNTAVTVLKTAGKLTTGAVTYPNTDGTSGQYLTTNGSGIVSFTSLPAINLASGVTGTLPIANGGTGSSTKNFVDLTTDQTIAGVKTFSGSSTVVNQNLTVNAAGTSGQGIILSDDGDIVDNNDGAATFRFTGGVKINNDKGSAGTTTKITLANTGAITAAGSVTASQLISNVATGTAPLVVTSTTPVANLSIGGNAATATKLAATKNINGVAFDGSADITVTAAAGTLTGSTLASNVVNSSLTSVGTIASGTWNGTTIAIANGGTGATNASAAFDALSPMTTAGDIIYGGTSGTGTRLAKGTDGQVLTLASGVPTWASGVSTITSKTASYTLTTSDNYVIASSGSGITFTLPTASGNTGKEYTIKNISSSNVTIATTGSQKIVVDAANSTATTATLGIEASNNWIRVISDGTQWIAFRALF
jgi:hypothetical protein